MNNNTKFLIIGFVLAVLSIVVYNNRFLSLSEVKNALQKGKSLKCYNPNNFAEKPVIVTRGFRYFRVNGETFLTSFSKTANAEYCVYN